MPFGPREMHIVHGPDPLREVNSMKAKVTLIIDGTQNELISTLGTLGQLGTIHALDFPSTASAIDVAKVQSSTPTTVTPKKRTMSAATRRKMSLAQQKRHKTAKRGR